MHSTRLSTILIVCSVAAFVLILAQCSRPSASITTELDFWNLGDTATYVGIQTCRGCHSDIYNTFIETGMGKSFDVASLQKSAGNFDGKHTLYDSLQNFYYQPFWRNDSLFLKEFRLDGRDTIHKIEKKIHYIVGSGQHTNSHIYVENGYYFQAPFTAYTQSSKLDLPPGFENGNNARFSRIIGLECMSCHNAMPTDFVQGSENKFDKVPHGIDCERCHGPGSLHVKKIGLGNITDTANHPDLSIVNPKRLSPARQFDVCQRCHLQGNAVLAEGKDFFDFKPGMDLTDVMDIYLPRFTNSSHEFIMASHVDRFTQSKCYIGNETTFNCTSCHNPHVSVKATNIARFNQTCKSCHTAAPLHNCSAPKAEIQKADFNCVQCHMPKSGSIDIPHVTVHDHLITKPGREKITDETLKKFVSLVAVNNKKPTDRSRILAFLQQYERFEADPQYLDSAFVILKKQGTNAHEDMWIHYHFLKKEYSSIVALVEKNGGKQTWYNRLSKPSTNNVDAWTAYRIAEAYRSFKDYGNAQNFIERAIFLAPAHPDFLLKKASILSLQEDYYAAAETYRLVLAMQPNIAEAWSDLGFVLLVMNDLEEAEIALKKAISLHPDYIQARMNMASYYLATRNIKQAEHMLKSVLAIAPNHPKALEGLQYIRNLNP